mmetsp:Transcript_49405/g.105164  ORF Transcript_49405/g.105164 Transcript_49405/m.105164 type:complete len:570 (-) Transcript_49405:67-1776(-)
MTSIGIGRWGMLLRLLRLGVGVHPDEVVNAEDGNGGLGSEFERLELGNQRFQNACSDRVANGVVRQVKTIPAVLLLLLILACLRGVVPHAEGCEEVNGIHGSILGENLGDGEESLGKLSNRPLLIGVKGASVVLEVQAEGRFAGAAPGDDGVGLHCSRHGAQGVVNGSLGLVQHELVGTTDQDGGGLLSLAALDEDEVIVANALLNHLVRASQILGIELLVSVHCGHREEQLGTSALGDSLDVLLVNSPGGQHTSIHQVLHGEVIDTLGCEQHGGASINNLLDLLLRDVHLLLSNSLELLWVIDDDVDPHGHSVPLEVEIQKGNLRIRDVGGHLLGASEGLDGVAASHELRLAAALTVGLDDVDLVHRVLGLAGSVRNLHRLDSIDDDFGEKFRLSANELRRECRLRDVEQDILVQLVNGHAQIGLDVLDSLFHRHSVAADDDGGVDVVLDKLVRSLQKLRSHDDHGRGAVANFSVLQVRQLYQDLRSGMLNLQLLENRGSIVGDGHIANVIDQHLVESLRAQRALQDVRKRHHGRDVCSPDIGAALALALQAETQIGIRHVSKFRARP